MSRIGKKPVPLPKGVTASVDGQTVKVKGPKGELSVKLVPEVSATIGDDGITANLLGPIVVNTRTRVARQVVLAGNDWTTKEPLSGR